MKNRILLLFVYVSLIFTSCNKPDTESTLFEGENYYPLETGRFVIFDVKKYEYTVLGTIDSSKFQIKEMVGDTISTLDKSKISYKLLRYKRSTSLETWTLDSIWEIWSNSKIIVKNENGQQFIKLSFPLKNGLNWNGNTYNNLEPQNYIVSNLNERLTLGTVYFPDNTLKVTEVLDTNKISRVINKEYYAKNVGLIYREVQNLQFDQEHIGEYKITSGIKYFQTVSSYGKE